MSDLIKLLPDAVANQIAAGEVIQRPASAVKELLENAIDAGADNVQLIIKDAGKTLIQVVDNGSGMSQADARLCFARHATSKIKQASDLFSIRTMGFRGEALASVAAISRLEIKTRRTTDEMGCEVIVEATRLESQRAVQCAAGSSIAVKNLFFNTPARRNFLKSDSVEKRHILVEFYRIALAFPDISFQLYQNGKLTHQLEKGKLKQRIGGLFGHHYNQRLVPVEEHTDIVSVSGFAAKPEYAKKTRGEQFFFVNRRYVRSPYLNHAVEKAFEELIANDAHPGFFLFLELQPEQLDVNVHPTKTEIKFQDEKYVYQVIRSSVKRALGRYSVSPSLDFERETAFDDLPLAGGRAITPPSIHIDPAYNPFGRDSNSPARATESLSGRFSPKQWEQLFPGNEDHPLPAGKDSPKQTLISPDWQESQQDNGQNKFFQLHNRYILTPVKSGLMIIDQQRAHERVLFDKYQAVAENRGGGSQQLLFPETIMLNENDAGILQEIIDEIRKLGFGIHESGNNAFAINAIPAGMHEDSPLQSLVEGIIENVQKYQADPRHDLRSCVIRSLARRLAVKPGKALSHEEMAELTDRLFACAMPQHSPGGKPVLSILDAEELSARFR